MINDIIDYRIEYDDGTSCAFSMTVTLLGHYSILRQEDVEFLQETIIWLAGNLNEISSREFLKQIKSFIAAQGKTHIWVQLWN